MHIRPGRPADAEAMCAFQVAMARETENLELEPSTVLAGVRGVFAEPSRGRYWVAEEGGEIIASLLVVPEWSDWRNGTVWWIHSLYVVPESRRRGVFRALFEHLRQLVGADESLKGLRLYVERNNRDACRTYEALGMDGEHYRLYEWMKP
jgi:GNAT superfamily N-acetyltransferase